MSSEDYLEKKRSLKQAYYIDRLLKGKQNEIQKLRVESVQLSGSTEAREVQSSSSTNDKIGEIVAKIADLECILRSGMEELLLQKHSITEKINKLSNHQHRMILEYRYVYLYDWYEVAEEMGYSYRHTLRLHKKALDELVVIEKQEKENKTCHTMSHENVV